MLQADFRLTGRQFQGRLFGVGQELDLDLLDARKFFEQPHIDGGKLSRALADEAVLGPEIAVGFARVVILCVMRVAFPDLFFVMVITLMAMFRRVMVFTFMAMFSVMMRIMLCFADHAGFDQPGTGGRWQREHGFRVFQGVPGRFDGLALGLVFGRMFKPDDVGRRAHEFHIKVFSFQRHIQVGNPVNMGAVVVFLFGLQRDGYPSDRGACQ